MPAVETVTVLITDLVGSTGLASRLELLVCDPLPAPPAQVSQPAIAQPTP
jgi:hypothetical protein